jgi:N-acetylglucosamine kinase-like BadF-type ATPase
VFLGVDGGGTKTAFCLVTADGEVAARTEAPTTYVAADVDRLVAVLRAGVTDVCGAAGISPAQVQRAFFGLPAYGESSVTKPLLDAAPLAVLGHDRYDCGNDMVCGWAGSLATADGINVISGTGSMAYGERHGHGVRAGGWGELFGDEGSAHWIGLQGLAAFTRMSDGREPRGPLHALLRERLGLTHDLDVLDLVLHEWGGERAKVASVSPVVVDATAAGDRCAHRILADAAGELVLVVDAVRRRLGFEDGEAVPVSYSGGVFRAEAVRDLFGKTLAAQGVSYELREPQYPPVIGAALYAARQAGTPLDAGALARLRDGG